jgi:glutamate---cysteine ligase / carboxylate-amine ligase
MKLTTDGPERLRRQGSGRTVGIEEEFLLVNPATGRPVPVAELSLAKRKQPAGTTAGPALALEVQQEQIEAISPVCSTLAELSEAVRQGRALADEAARSVGARAVAMGTSPLATNTNLVPAPRNLEMAARFGVTLEEQLTCGYHVHVFIGSREEGVAVLDRIRVWLPLLLALSANSPFWRGTDTGYESFRYQAWSRWPSTGPCDVFGSESAYDRHLQLMLASGVLLDEGMVYFDARLSRNHPTVEVRLADVCLEPAHVTVLAAVVRALVERAARDWRGGLPAPSVSAAHLRLATWRASKSGIKGQLLHPLLNTPCPAPDAVQALITHIRPILAESGDEGTVTMGLKRIMVRGTGSQQQREIMKRTYSFKAVVTDSITRTHAGDGPPLYVAGAASVPPSGQADGYAAW